MRRILCYGDSNTYGYDPTDYLGKPYPNPWPSLLAQDTGWDVINLGMNGREIPSGSRVMEWTTDLLASYLPADQLILMLGTNDLLNLPAAQAVERTVSRMEQLLVELKEHFPELPILLMAPPKIVLDVGYLDMSLQMAMRYRGLAEAHGLEYVDLASLPLQMAADGIHLTEKDHEAAAKAVRDKLGDAG